jgi:hypothetical protein
LITLWAAEILEAGTVPRGASWYTKTHLTFSDAIAAVRYRLWLPDEFFTSTGRLDIRAWRHRRSTVWASAGTLDGPAGSA